MTYIGNTTSNGELIMSKGEGVFSTSLEALKLQLDNLLVGSGGARTAELLDLLSTLTVSEQNMVLDRFIRTTRRIIEGEIRFSSSADVELQEMEDKLYNDILSAMNDAHASGAESVGFPELKGFSGDKKLSVVDGGKLKNAVRVKSEISTPSTPIDFETARRTRRVNKSNPVVN